MILFLAFLWAVAPLAVYLLGGSVFWMVAAFIIGGLVVFGTMGVQSLLDEPAPPSPEAVAAEDDFRGQLQRHAEEAALATRQRNLDRIVQAARAAPTECPICRALVKPDSEQAHREWHFTVDGWIGRREDYEHEQAERA